MTELDRKRVWWVGRVPETSTRAKALVAEEPATWQGTEVLRWYEQEVRIGERIERWIVAQSAEGVERQHATLQRRAEQERQLWTKRLRALEQRPFACEADAQIACSEARKGAPRLSGNRPPGAGQYPACQTGPPTRRRCARAGLERA